MRLLPCGDAALLVELDDLDHVLGLAEAVATAREEGGLPDVVDVVPAARTVLFRCRPEARAVTAVASELRRLDVGTASAEDRAEGAVVVEIPVTYDGPDLAEVAELAGIDEPDVVRLHTEATWTVAFTGFAPGFGYLVGGDERLTVPRRDEPRTAVPAGSVGLAGQFTGAYPRESPGGWQLIGRTEETLWDPERDPPALLVPGARVRFVEAG